MKIFRPTALVAAAASLLPAAARADVSWEHTGSVSVSSMPQPIMKFKAYTNMTPQRQRVLVKYIIPGIPTTVVPPDAFSGTDWPKALRPKKVGGTGSYAFIQRLDDDKLIAYESQTKAFVSESRKLVYSKLMPDPWKKVAPELSAQAVPELSEVQRERLGAEIRATLSPLTKRFSKTYFRALPNARMMEGMLARGYRLTQMINVGGFRPSQAQWMRLSFEWWLTGDLPGDETIKTLQGAMTSDLKALGYPSKSMWRNEMGYVLLHTLPPEYLTALKTFAPGPSFSEPSFGGTPLQMVMTVSPPPLQRALFGEVKATVRLTKRDTSTLAESVFAAPDKYTRLPLAPYFKQLDALREKMTFDEMFKQMERAESGGY